MNEFQFVVNRIEVKVDVLKAENLKKSILMN